MGGMTIQGEQTKGARKRMDTGVLTGLICYVLWGAIPSVLAAPRWGQPV